MSFSIDRQTLDELNLLGKFRQGSVYHLFNQVKTSGGEKVLDEMFRLPLTNASEINQRSELFRYFQQRQLPFPFDVQQLSLMRDYLDTGAGLGKWRVLIQAVVRKTLSSLTRDERYKKNIQGFQATIETLKSCYHFCNMVKDAPPVFVARVNTVRKLLETPELERLRSIDIYKALSVTTLAHFDHLLKTQLAEPMEALLQFMYESDVFIGVGKVAAARGFTYALAMPVERNLFSVRGLRHPAIEKAVGNSLHFDESNNVIFLTGANMAGKSTLMKSMGIAIYLGHMGFPVAADAMEFSVREGLYTSINVADNIALGYSHFYAEVVRVKQAAEAAASGRRLMLMFDELFKGTNVKDAYDGTLAVTEAFSGYTNCLFVVSTHIIEVGEALKKNNNIQFRFLPTIMEGHKPRYTYSLQEGITEDRQGMMIIRNEGILEMIRS